MRSTVLGRRKNRSNMTTSFLFIRGKEIVVSEAAVMCPFFALLLRLSLTYFVIATYSAWPHYIVILFAAIAAFPKVKEGSK